MKSIILIFIGGGTGSLVRFYLGKLLNSSSSIPFNTLIINILASFILGFLVGKTLSENDSLKALLAIGFCGGFSTFSTFSNETLQLLLNGKYFEGLFYVFCSVILCLLATYGGIFAGKYL